MDRPLMDYDELSGGKDEERGEGSDRAVSLRDIGGTNRGTSHTIRRVSRRWGVPRRTEAHDSRDTREIISEEEMEEEAERLGVPREILFQKLYSDPDDGFVIREGGETGSLGRRETVEEGRGSMYGGDGEGRSGRRIVGVHGRLDATDPRGGMRRSKGELKRSKWHVLTSRPEHGVRNFWRVPRLYKGHPVIAVVIPLYNEDSDALRRTLEGLALMQLELFLRYHVRPRSRKEFVEAFQARRRGSVPSARSDTVASTVSEDSSDDEFYRGAARDEAARELDDSEPNKFPVLTCCIIADGLAALSPSMSSFLHALFGFDPEEAAEDGGTSVKHIVYSAVEERGGGMEPIHEQAFHRVNVDIARDETAPNPILRDERELEWVLAEFHRWELPLFMQLLVKKANLKKHNSHEWFFESFARDVRCDLALATDCGTVFGPKAGVYLYDHMLTHPKCVACTGHQLVMRRGDQDSAEEMAKNVEEPFLPAIARLSQGFDFASGQALFKPSVAMAGFLDVIPGPLGLFRYPYLSLARDDSDRQCSCCRRGVCGPPGVGCSGFCERLCSVRGGCRRAFRGNRARQVRRELGCCGMCIGSTACDACYGCDPCDSCEGCCGRPVVSKPHTKPLNYDLVSPLSLYFSTVNARTRSLVTANLQIAEDRILSWSSAVDGCRPVVIDGVVTPVKDLESHYVPSAIFFFESEYPLDRLVGQRRRWTNGSALGNFWLLGYFLSTIFTRDHSTWFNVVVTTNIISQIIIFVSICLLPAILVVAFTLSIRALGLLLAVWTNTRELIEKQNCINPGDLHHHGSIDMTELIGTVLVALYGIALLFHLFVAQFSKFSPITWGAVAILGAALMICVMFSFIWSILTVLVSKDLAEAFYFQLACSSGAHHARELFNVGAMVTGFFALLPVMLTALLRPEEAIILLRNAVVYYPLLPTFVSALLLYSMARLSDISWGNRGHAVKKPKKPTESTTSTAPAGAAQAQASPTAPESRPSITPPPTPTLGPQPSGSHSPIPPHPSPTLSPRAGLASLAGGGAASAAAPPALESPRLRARTDLSTLSGGGGGVGGGVGGVEDDRSRLPSYTHLDIFDDEEEGVAGDDDEEGSHARDEGGKRISASRRRGGWTRTEGGGRSDGKTDGAVLGKEGSGRRWSNKMPDPRSREAKVKKVKQWFYERNMFPPGEFNFEWLQQMKKAVGRRRTGGGLASIEAKATAKLRAEWTVMASFASLRWLIVILLLGANLSVALGLWKVHSTHPDYIVYAGIGIMLPSFYPMTRSFIWALYYRLRYTFVSCCCADPDKRQHPSTRENASGIPKIAKAIRKMAHKSPDRQDSVYGRRRRSVM